MPLIEVRQLSPHARLGIWRIDESSPLPPRQRERMAVQQLLVAMTSNPQLTIGHEPSGRPYIIPATSTSPSEGSGESCLSISHTILRRHHATTEDETLPSTYGYAAIILSDFCAAGIDIEQRSDRVERIATRFIRDDEPAHTTDEKLLLWSAKETVYKLYSADRLQFFDMQTLSIGEQHLQIANLRRDTIVDVSYEFTPDYVLTWALAPTTQQDHS